MPIYEYKCASCGHEKEVLQKMSDAPLRQCPACGKSTLTKLISAAGFQLKGSGWYATDFKGGSKSAQPGQEKVDGATKVESKPGDEGKANTASKAADDKQAKGDNKPREAAKSDAPATSPGASPAGQ